MQDKPLRRIIASFTVAAALALGACGDSGAKSPSAVMSAADAKLRLIDVATVGSSWQVGSPINELDLAAFNQVPCDDLALDATTSSRLTGITGIQFEPINSSGRHLIEMVVSADPKQLTTDIGALIGAFDACAARKTVAVDGGSFSIAKLSIGALGDQRGGYTFSGTPSPDGPVWYGRAAIVRIGSVALTLGLTEILENEQAKPTIGDADFIRIAKTATERFAK